MAQPSSPIVGRYEITDPAIGQGGMGVVYKAYDTVTRRYVALKTIWGSVNSTALTLFEKEWSVLARLSHPNIVDIIETGQFEEAGQKKPFFVMPLLPGATLDYLIKKASQRLTVERTVDILSQACRGLQAAHDQGLVHRDLKPSNIFVLDDDSVKLIDFGVVHLTDMSTMTGMKGTLNYLAPELIDHKPPSVLSDVFALGVVCYEALTRRKPFERPTEDETVEAIRIYIPPPVSDINSAVNEPLSRTVHKAMAKQPWHRFSSARELGEILKKALRSEPIEYFDSAKIQPRIERVKKAQGEGDYQFAKEILSELEAEGHIDLQISLLRMQLDQAIKQKTIRQLMESARTRVEEEEYPLALQKVQEALEIDGKNADALALKTQIERQRNEKQIDNWYRLVQQHLENQLFSQARLGLEEILRINPADAKAHGLLDQVDQQEKESNKIREEKEQLYQAALKSYECGEVSTALDKLERLLALSRQSTRTPNPEKDAQYQSLYNQIRSEREAFRNGYAEARRWLEDREFARALALCTEFLGKNPSDPMFQALKLEVEERERQERSAAVADVDRRVETEADLDRKINILKEAVESYPAEPHFKEALKLVRGRRELLDSIVNRAKQYEEHGQFNEALGQWDILRNIYPLYPGLDAEVQRLRLKREGQLREEAKSRWVRQIDQNLEGGDYEKAQMAVREALAEFPGDRELASLEKLSAQGVEKRNEAQQHFAEGKKLLAGGSAVAGIDRLRKAVELNGRDRTVRGAFLSALLERARARLNEDWHESQALVDEALKLDGSNPVARSLLVQVQDRERQALVDACVLEARELQAAGDLQGALDKVRQSLIRHPREARLSQLESTLRKNLAGRAREREPDQQQAVAEMPPRNPRSNVGLPESWASLPGMGAAQDRKVVPALDRTVQLPGPVPPRPPVPPGPSWSQRMATALGKIKLPRLSPRRWAIAATVLFFAIAAIVVYRVWPGPPKALPIVRTELHANVSGVTFLLDGQPVVSPVALTPGRENTLLATREGFQSSTRKITPVAGQPPPPIQFMLSPLLPRLRVLSDVPGIKVSVGDQPAVALENGNLDVDQVAAGPQAVRILAGSQRVLELAVNVEPGNAATIAGPLTPKKHSVAVATILGTHARVFASSDLQGNVNGKDLQAIPPEGMEVDTKASGSTFNFSDGQTLALDFTDQPALIIVVRAHGGAPPPVAAPATAHLQLQSMPPDSVVIIDGDMPRPVATTGQITLSAGDHVIILRLPHYEDSAPITVILRPGKTTGVSVDRFTLVQQGSLVFKISPHTASVTYRLDEQQTVPPRRATGNETVWLKPGKYSINIDAPGYQSEVEHVDVRSGQNKEVNKSLRALAVETPPPPVLTLSKADLFADGPWTWTGAWWTLKKNADGWLKPKQGTFEFTIQRKSDMIGRAKKVEWTIDNRGDGNRVVYSVNGNSFRRVAYQNGTSTPEKRAELTQHSGDYKLIFQISPHHIVVSEAGGAKLDEYDRPNSGTPLGKIGFKGEIGITGQQK